MLVLTLFMGEAGAEQWVNVLATLKTSSSRLKPMVSCLTVYHFPSRKGATATVTCKVYLD